MSGLFRVKSSALIMKSLIIGFGSIGMRHSEVLRDLGSKVSVLSKRKIDSMKSFRTLESALSGKNYNLIITLYS